MAKQKGWRTRFSPEKVIMKLFSPTLDVGREPKVLFVVALGNVRMGLQRASMSGESFHGRPVCSPEPCVSRILGFELLNGRPEVIVELNEYSNTQVLRLPETGNAAVPFCSIDSNPVEQSQSLAV